MYIHGTHRQDACGDVLLKKKFERDNSGTSLEEPVADGAPAVPAGRGLRLYMSVNIMSTWISCRMQGVRPPVVNPDEMETLPFFPGPKGTIPDGPPPSCLGAVLGAIHLHPPWLDYRLQQKKHFKEVVLNQRGEGTQSHDHRSFVLFFAVCEEFMSYSGRSG